jgi:trans-2-enoyl-CoA reductase
LAVGTTDGYALAMRIAAGFAIAAAVTVAIAFQRVRFVPPGQQAVAETSTPIATSRRPSRRTSKTEPCHRSV